MRNIAQFQIIGRVSTIKLVGKTLRITICANYPFKDKQGNWKDDALWNEVTIFDENRRTYIQDNIEKGDLVHVRGQVKQNSFERGGAKVYTVDLIANEFSCLAKAKDTTE